MGIKKYEFCADEISVLREAMAEYKHFINPPENASDRRQQIYKTACALHDQFVNDLRLLRE